MDYQKKYIEYNQTLHLEHAEQKAKEILSVLPKKSSYTSLIDVACGAGRVTAIVSKNLNTNQNTAIDTSKEMIQTAKKVNPETNIHWINQDIMQFDAAGQIFDLAICIDILEHLEDDLAFLKKIAGIAKEIVLRVPLEKSFFSILLIKFGIFDSWQDTLKRYGHVHHYDEPALYKLFESANTTVINKKAFPMPKRSRMIFEIFRILFFPISLISMYTMIRVSGGFMVYYLGKKG